MLRKILILIAALVTVSLFVSCGSDSQSKETDTPSKQPATEQATGTGGEFDFAAYDLDGTLRQSTEWVGNKPVVLNFWGTWCPPCRKEIPDLIKVYEEYQPKGVEIIGLAVRDNAGKVAQFTRQQGMNWVMLMAEVDLVARYRVSGVPTTIFLDRQGNEIGRFIGPRDYETFRKAFDAIM
ncbi:MAG: TlpA family protein disulfide reductase [candidate division Zixibacteria bacterium]|nr:TlpA family protein disulfide reductase [candidate division Zixibacteria bacterium]